LLSRAGCERFLLSPQDQLRTFTTNNYFFQKETHFRDTELCKALQSPSPALKNAV
jgi:hypothetical protein